MLQTGGMFSASSLIILGLCCLFGLAEKQAPGNNVKKSQGRKIAYGGVLNKTLSVAANDTDVLNAAKFAVAFAQKRHPGMVPLDETGSIQQYQLADCKQMKLVFTVDNSKPHIIEMLNPVTGQGELYPLVWGVTYSFTVSWSPVPGSTTHSFTVTEYWDGHFYMYEHTFFPAKLHPSSQTETRSPSDAINENSVHLHMEVDMGTGHIQQKQPYVPDTSNSKEEPLCEDDPRESPVSRYSSQSQCKNIEKQDLADDYSSDYHSTSNAGARDAADRPSGDGLCEGPTTFSMLTFNIWNTNEVPGSKDDYIKRIAHIGQLMQSSKADIIGFQEVRFEDGKGGFLGPNQVQHLSTHLQDYQFVFQPAQIQTHTLPTRTEEGVAIFSRFPILHHDYLLLPRSKDDIADSHQRILLHAEILVPRLGRIHVFNTHLSLSHRARQTSVVKMWQHMNKYKEPVFLMGDFNAEKHNDEVRFLFGKKVLKKTSTKGFHDVWQLKFGYEEDGFTYNTLDDELTKRIDFIFMRDDPSLAFHDVRLLDDGLRKEEAASDHIGVLAQFLVKEAEPP